MMTDMPLLTRSEIDAFLEKKKEEDALATKFSWRAECIKNIAIEVGYFQKSSYLSRFHEHQIQGDTIIATFEEEHNDCNWGSTSSYTYETLDIPLSLLSGTDEEAKAYFTRLKDEREQAEKVRKESLEKERCRARFFHYQSLKAEFEGCRQKDWIYGVDLTSEVNYRRAKYPDTFIAFLESLNPKYRIGFYYDQYMMMNFDFKFNAKPDRPFRFDQSMTSEEVFKDAFDLYCNEVVKPGIIEHWMLDEDAAALLMRAPTGCFRTE